MGGRGMGMMWSISPDLYAAIIMSVFCTIYGLMFVLCTWLAILKIRPAIIKPVYDPDTGRRASPRPSARAKIVSAERVIAKPVEPDVPSKIYEPLEPPRRRPRTVRARRAFTVPPLRDGDPFLWKERHFSGRLPVLESGVAWGCAVSVIVAFLGLLAIILFAGILVKVLNGQMPGEIARRSVRTEKERV